MSYEDDIDLIVPSIEDPPAESSKPSPAVREFVHRIVDEGDTDAADELKQLAEAARRGDMPVDVTDS